MSLRISKLIFWSFLFCSVLSGQSPVFFLEANSSIQDNFSSHISLAVTDINGDFRDDIIRFKKDSIVIHLQVNGGLKFLPLASSFYGGLPVSTNVADIDNDNKNEIICAGFKDGFKVYQIEDDYLKVELIEAKQGSAYAQGCTMSDVNNDGWIDYTFTNDIGYNLLYVNDQNGSFFESDIIDFQLLTVEESEGNYNSIWFDADMDDDLDLFVSKCHISAVSFDDPRRINQLYLNEGDFFKESAEPFNLAQGDQTWCSDSGDLDNDGDEDLVIINHGTSCMILENLDGVEYRPIDNFTLTGPVEGLHFQVGIQDFNNDGMSDICIVGANNNMLFNIGNLTFDNYTNTLGTGNITSMATGDFNNDGFIDVLASYGVEDSGIEDRLLINQGSGNHFIKFSLNGVISNSNGIGTKLEVFTKGKKQTKRLNSGTSYGISNSLNLHFGIADAEQIDSLFVKWPSGVKDVFRNLNVNSHYVITEGQCLDELLYSNLTHFESNCKDLEGSISSNENLNLLWNTGVRSREVEFEIGYHQGVSDDGCHNSTPLVFIEKSKELPKPHLNLRQGIRICKDEEISLGMSNNQTVLWSNGDTGNFTNVSRKGWAYGFIENGCETLFSDSIYIDTLKVESPHYDTLQRGIHQLSVDSDVKIEWYTNSFNFLQADSALELDLQSDTSFYYRSVLNDRSLHYLLAPELEISYDTTGRSGCVQVAINESIVLEDIKLNSSGELLNVNMSLIDMEGQHVFSQEYILPKGESSLPIDVDLDKGEYILCYEVTTNEDSGLYFHEITEQRKFTNAHLSFEFNNKLPFITSINYNILLDDCYSEFIPYYVNLDLSTGFNNLENEIDIFPNPFSSFIQINTGKPAAYVRIVNLLGQQVYFESEPDLLHNINTDSWNSGLYFIEIRQNQQQTHFTFVK